MIKSKPCTDFNPGNVIKGHGVVGPLHHRTIRDVLSTLQSALPQGVSPQLAK